MFPPSAQKRLVQQTIDTMAAKRICNNHATVNVPSHDAPTAQRRSIRILTRRYALTNTVHKYLEIGINVGPPSYVEIVIGDKWGNEVKLSLEAWKELLDKQAIIREYFNKDNTSVDSLRIGHMSVRFFEYKNEKCACFELNNVRVLMTAPTLDRMFSLDKCIAHMHNWLATCIHVVDAKFYQFNALVYSIPNRKDKIACIEDSECYDKNQPIDCELLAVAF